MLFWFIVHLRRGQAKFSMEAYIKYMRVLAFLVVNFYSYIAQATTVDGIIIDFIGKCELLEEDMQATEEVKKSAEKEALQPTEEVKKSPNLISLVYIIEKDRNPELKKTSNSVKYENASVDFRTPTIEEEDSDLDILNDNSASPPRKKYKFHKIDRKVEKIFLNDSNIYNASRHLKKRVSEKKHKNREDYIWKNNYLSSEDSYRNLRLSFDALLISEANTNERKSSTVIFCVLLRDKYGYLKKFVFHNLESNMSGTMRAKAHELGYDIIQSGQSHAEAQFLQFLYKRNDARPGHYTHIVKMGCSKKHCSECDALLKLLLGPNYHKITSSINHGKESDIPLPTVEADPPIIKGDDVFFRYVTSIHLKIVHKEEAVDEGAVYRNYYLPKSLKDQIKHTLGNDNIDLSSARFNKKEDQKRIALEAEIKRKVEKMLSRTDINKFTDNQIDTLAVDIIEKLHNKDKNLFKTNVAKKEAVTFCRSKIDEINKKLAKEANHGNQEAE
jgi:hypothetical protein